MKALASILVIGALCLISLSPAHAVPFSSFTATLDGASINPPTASAGTGSASAVFDYAAHTLTFNVTFAGLSSNTTSATLHCCTTPPTNVGIAMPPLIGFPLGVTSGTYSRTFDTTMATTYTSNFLILNGGTVAGAEAALLAGFLAGQSYLNIHTANYPGGEIRGFFTPTPVPEPGSFGLLILGMSAFAVAVGRRSL